MKRMKYCVKVQMKKKNRLVGVKKEVSGYLVDELTGIHREDSGWFVDDLKTGLMIVKAKTMQEAVDKYHDPELKAKLTEARKDRFYQSKVAEFGWMPITE